MQATKFPRLVPALMLAAFAALAAPTARGAAFQDPGPMPPPFTPPGQTDPQQEMRELFKQVELKLREIDKVLYDAGAGDAPEGPLEDAGIDDLLRHARQQSSDAQEGIDRILELARQQQQQQQSGGSQQQQQQPSGESPLDEQRQQDGGERERTPDKPQESPEPQEGDGKPEDNKPDDPNRDPQNREANPPDKGETERAGGGDGSAPWGSLPIHGREVFRVKGGADLPPQYRDWIDGYHRRLQRVGGKR